MSKHQALPDDCGESTPCKECDKVDDGTCPLQKQEIPTRIYLQIVDECGNKLQPGKDEVTWCVDRIHDSDVEYVRAQGATTIQRYAFVRSGKFRSVEERPDGDLMLFADLAPYAAAQVAEAVKKERTERRLTEVDPLIGLVNRLLRIAANNRVDQLAEEVLSAVRKTQEEKPSTRLPSKWPARRNEPEYASGKSSQ